MPKIISMKFKELVYLCRDVLLDWRVIGITVAMILYVVIVRYVIKYKKKPPKLRKQHSVTQNSVSAGKTDASEQESGGEEDSGEE